jgi:hypothetical protein
MSTVLLPELEEQLREAARRTAPRPADGRLRGGRGRGPGLGRGRRRGRGGRRRALVLALLLALALASVAVAAVRHFTGEGAPAPKRYGLGSPVSGPGRPLPSGARLLGVRAADPDGDLPWGIRLYRTTRRAACWQVGRVLDGRLGVIGRDGLLAGDGLFHELPVEVDQCRPLDGAGHVFAFQNALALDNGVETRLTCHPRGAVPERGRRAACPSGSGRLLLYGFLGPEARAVRLAVAGQAPRTARVGEEGAFLFALRLPDTLDGPRYALTATYADGTTRPVGDVWAGAPDSAVGGGAPGYVPPERALPAPAHVRRPLRVSTRRVGRNVVYRVAFRAPVAVRRYGAGYSFTLRGPAGGRDCEQRPFGTAGTLGDVNVRAGQRLTYTFSPGWQMRWNRGWCPGTYRVTVLLHDRAHPVGSFRFTA